MSEPAFDPLRRLHRLRTVPHLWINVIATTRMATTDKLAWTVVAKLTDPIPYNVQYTFEDLDDALQAVETWIEAQKARTKPKPKMKMKLKRSTK
jgi:hypothetical protein